MNASEAAEELNLYIPAAGVSRLYCAMKDTRPLAMEDDGVGLEKEIPDGEHKGKVDARKEYDRLAKHADRSGENHDPIVMGTRLLEPERLRSPGVLGHASLCENNGCIGLCRGSR